MLYLMKIEHWLDFESKSAGARFLASVTPDWFWFSVVPTVKCRQFTGLRRSSASESLFQLRLRKEPHSRILLIDLATFSRQQPPWQKSSSNIRYPVNVKRRLVRRGGSRPV